MDDDVPRRRVLGAAGAVAVAGCLDTDDSGETADSRDTGDERAGDEEDSDGAETTEPSPNESNDAAETIHEGYETTTVRAVGADGDELGRVTAAIADTDDLRYLGLSDTDELPPDRGMLFVFGAVAERSFVMREMDFGIDIVYADADGTITGIHHAPAPGPDENGNDQHYPGRGQYVLEVAYEWTSDHGVSEGDVLEFALEE
ncbi:DUF192 domain-containing protein [Natrinema altunense]|uniref:DUF192 domain-containing protein n=1 Tax=Natrinema altunense (strain JCM 12890 / CGMCC 1.3731 / AJ2) TaxID=1227494 RepID=L9ZFG7_NATA2|nr:DUF192 domain-containing protein [Natrinema altunense]ELY85195.1 hypothetical protein C485_13010 [Natrinema altunense JCM 12890]